MSFRTVRHLCGHDARYRVRGSRSVVEHHVHELERSPCTPCARAATETRHHIYLGVGARIISFPDPRGAGNIAPRGAEIDRGAA